LDLSPFQLTQSGDYAWAGGDSGQFWASKDHGKTWELHETDFSGNPIFGMAALPDFSTDQILLIGVRNPSHHQVQIWQSTDGGKNWSKWYALKDEDSSLRFIIYEENGKQVLIGSQTHVIQWDGNAWASERVTSEDAPITALAAIPGSDLKIVALADRVIYHAENAAWQPFGDAIQGQSVVALHLVTKNKTNHLLFALTRDGMIWRCKF
jgi:hypothetical protein